MITSRRHLLLSGLGVSAAIIAGFNPLSHALAAAGATVSATAITQVFGEGQKFTAVAVEFGGEIDTTKLTAGSFKVDGRTVTKVYANSIAAPAAQGANGKFVIIELSPDDADAMTYIRGQGPDKAATIKPAKATVMQTGALATVDGKTIAAGDAPIETSKVSNLVVDDFKQFEYKDAKTGETMKYNVFVPKNYDKAKSYPLVLFMHDAGVTSDNPLMTLVQGLGPVAFANPDDQAKREAFVLAPQYARWVVNDKSEATGELDMTIDLIKQLAGEYSIDQNRLYTTGQSGGGMMSIAMDIKYPDFFAASFLVACQWDARLVKPLAADKLWIMVSQGDEKAYPGQNAITEALEKDGAKVSRAVWDGTSSADVFAANVKAMEGEGNAIHYVALKKGTVVPAGQEDNGGGNHVNTWRIAYTIEGIREWLFAQHK